MRRASIVLSCLGFVALVLALDAMTTRIFSNPQGFESGASVAVLFWMGIAVTLSAFVCCAAQLILKKKAPWRSGPFIWCATVLLGYGYIWFFPPGGL